MRKKPTYEELKRRVKALEEESFKKKGVEKALRKSEERYRTLVDNVPVGVYRNTPGPKGKFLTANPAFLSMFGFDSEQELKRISVIDLYMNPDEWKEVSDNLLAQGSVTGVELRLKKRDGTPIWGSVSARVIYDETGKATFIDCTTEDITSRRQANEALRENEKRYRLLVDTMNDGLGVQDENGLITFVNDRFCKIVGYRKEEIMGHPVTDLLDKDNQIILKEQMVKRRKGECGPYEIAWTGKDGKKVTTIMSPTPLFDTESNFIGSFAVITDIEDLKRKEEEILHQKEFLNNVLESLTHPFYVIDAVDYTIKMANLAAGMDNLTETITCYALTHKRSKPCGGVEHSCPLEQVKKTKKPATAEHVHYDREGNRRNIEVHAFPIFDNRGNVVQAIEYNLDITERKQAEEALRRQKEYLAALHETSIGLMKRQNPAELLEAIVFRATSLVGTQHGFMYIYDPDRDVLEFQIGIGRFKNAVGFKVKSGEGQAGRSWQTKQPIIIDDYSIWEERVDSELFNGLRACITIPLKSGAGIIGLGYFDEGIGQFGKDEIDVLNRFADIASISLDNVQLYEKFKYELAERRNADKALREAHDELELRVEERTAELAKANEQLKKEIAQRKVAEETLRFERKQLLSIFDSIDEIAYVADPERNEILYANAALEKAFGRKPVGEKCYEVLQNRSSPCDFCTNEIILKEKGKPYRWEYHNPVLNQDFLITDRIIKWPDGRDVRFEFTINVTEAKRGEEERRKLEARLSKSKRLEAISSLAGGIAHEFNNALTTVMGNIQLLKMSLPDHKSVTEHTEAMNASCHRMANLTRQLLAYARGGKYQPKVISLSNFLEETLPIITSTIDRPIRLETDLPTDTFMVNADPIQMQMVLSVVVDNSAEAIEGEGRIRIVTGNEEIDEAFTKSHPGLNPGRYVCLSVEDDGKGMDEETQNKIFDPFFSTKFQGRGLGMAAVYGIVRNHDGWISVDSEPGKGTVVRIYLPAVEAKAKEKKIKTPHVEIIPGMETILVIEDEEMVMKVIRATLQMLDYRMLEAKTGKEAVDIAKRFDGRIDLALLDIKLPDISGDKLYPLIMESRPDLKVLVCSGYAIDGPAQGILNAGAQGFIQKPFDLKELSIKLRKILDGVAGRR